MKTEKDKIPDPLIENDLGMQLLRMEQQEPKWVRILYWAGGPIITAVSFFLMCLLMRY